MNTGIAVIIISLVVTQQTSASFFGEVTTSLRSWKSSVGKLFSDAATDLKDTFDCTVLALRQVYTGNNTVPDYYQKCQEQEAQNEATSIQSHSTTRTTISPNPTTVIQATSTKTNQPKPVDSKPQNYIIEKEIKIVKSDLLTKTRLLTDMNVKLEQELGDLSKHVNENFVKLQIEQKKQSIEKVMGQIDKLHDEEVIYENKTEHEINQVFEKVLTKLENNSIDKIELKQEIKSFLEELELNKTTSVDQELKKWKEEELRDLKEVKFLLQRHHNVINPRKSRESIQSTALKSVTDEKSFASATSSKQGVSTKNVRSESVTTPTSIPSTTAMPETTEKSTETSAIISSESVPPESTATSTTGYVPSESTDKSQASIPSTTEYVPTESSDKSRASIPSTTEYVPSESSDKSLASIPSTAEYVPSESSDKRRASIPSTAEYVPSESTDKSLASIPSTAEYVPSESSDKRRASIPSTAEYVPSESTDITQISNSSNSSVITEKSTENVTASKPAISTKTYKSTDTTRASIPSSSVKSVKTAKSTKIAKRRKPRISTKKVPAKSTVKTRARSPPTTVKSVSTKKSIGTVTRRKPMVSTKRVPSKSNVLAKRRSTTLMVLTTTKPPQTTKSSTTAFDDYHSLLSSDQKTIDSALNLFGKSRKAASIMAKVLQNTKTASSVFATPELLGR